MEENHGSRDTPAGEVAALQRRWIFEWDRGEGDPDFDFEADLAHYYRLQTAPAHERNAAVQTIASSWPDDPDTYPLLRDRAVSDRDGLVRQAALAALAAGWREHPATAGLLHERATTDPDAAVRRAAVQALAGAWADHPDTLPLLRERTTTDPDAAVRRAAVQALAGANR